MFHALALLLRSSPVIHTFSSNPVRRIALSTAARQRPSSSAPLRARSETSSWAMLVKSRLPSKGARARYWRRTASTCTTESRKFNSTCSSNLPGRSNAASRASRRFVQATTRIRGAALSVEMPSISFTVVQDESKTVQCWQPMLP